MPGHRAQEGVDELAGTGGAGSRLDREGPQVRRGLHERSHGEVLGEAAAQLVRLELRPAEPLPRGGALGRRSRHVDGRGRDQPHLLGGSWISKATTPVPK